MKCLSVRQPWAHLILCGVKPVENRSWYTDFRGPLLIHAGTKADPDALEALASIGEDIGHGAATALVMEWAAGTSPQCRPSTARGAIIGVVDVVECWNVGTTFSRLPDARPWACGPFCWVLRNPGVFPEPIPYKGRLGLFDVPDDVIPEGWVP